MATTDRSKTDRASRRAVRRQRRCPSALRLAAVLLPGCLAAVPALAQTWNAEAAVSSQLTWTNNSALGVTEGQDDTVLAVRPRISLRRDGGRLRVAGSAQLNAVTYANGTQSDRVLPEVDLTANLEAIERFFFIDAGVRVLQTSEDPFGAPASADAPSGNTITTRVTRLSPYIERAATPDLRYGLRSDNVKTSDNGSTFGLAASSATGYLGRHVAYIEHDPVPFGWRLEAERTETRYDDSAQPPQEIDLARASINFAVGPELSLGLRAGYERDSFLSGDEQDNTIYGAQLRWRPTERTLLTAFGEERFFGTSWRVAFDHRVSRLVWNMSFSRTVETAPQLLFALPAGGNVAALINALLPAELTGAARDRAVRETMARYGLPGTTSSPVTIYSQRLSIVNSRNVSLGYIGPRSSITLTGYSWRTEDALPRTGLGPDPTLNNNKQHGATLILSHRLTRLSTVMLSMDYSRIRALEAVGSDSTRQAEASLRLTTQASRQTSAFGGARYRKLGSNVILGGDETAVFAGLDHTF